MIEPVDPFGGGILDCSTVRHGPRCLITSVLYKPLIVSASALSNESPTLPAEAEMPASARRSENRTEVYWLPASVLSRVRLNTDAGSQYTAIHYGEALTLEELVPSVGTVGDALDNALCETTIGLYKTECIREGSPFRTGPIDTLADLENMTSAWVSWYNECRLMHRLDRRPPAEAEAEYYARLHAGKHTGHTE